MASSDEIRKYINLYESAMISEENKVEEYTSRIQAPEGFTKEEGHGNISSSGHVDTTSHRGEPIGDEFHYVKIVSNNITIYFDFHLDNNNDIIIYGHTGFNTPVGWKTFSKRGVGDSFMISTSEYSEYKLSDDPSKVIQDQVKRAEEAIARYQDSIAVPGLPGNFSISPEQKEEITKKLQANQTHMFRPAGMGVGYEISTQKIFGPLAGGFDPSPLAPKELADFFGVPKLFITNQDFD